MSIQSEIDRIKGNVTAALAKIAEKGVTVPDDANSDSMAALIEAIEAGGGGILGYNIISGTYTPTENMTSRVEIYSSGFISSSNTAVDAIKKRSMYFMFVMQPNSDYIYNIQHHFLMHRYLIN